LFLVTNVPVSDDEENENEFDEHVMVSVPSIKEMTQKMTDTRIFLQSRQVPEKVWNGFCDLESYINNIRFSSIHVQTKILDYLK
jgi:hypothetical protein